MALDLIIYDNTPAGWEQVLLRIDDVAKQCHTKLHIMLKDLSILRLSHHSQWGAPWSPNSARLIKASIRNGSDLNGQLPELFSKACDGGGDRLPWTPIRILDGPILFTFA